MNMGMSIWVDRSHASVSTGTASARRSSPESTTAERDPRNNVSLKSRVGLQAGCPFGTGQHHRWIGSYDRVVRGAQHGSRRSEAAPAFNRTVVCQVRLGDVEQRRDPVGLAALPSRARHAHGEPGIRANGRLAELVAQPQECRGHALLEEDVLGRQQHLSGLQPIAGSDPQADRVLGLPSRQIPIRGSPQ
jgi:hypothetical protein